ncbi:gluconate 2-dehydrogenase subunit 3 family protein [bacterium]|nr:gluconate 2-dehydrogenase subunit 3 family protein [bacterium]
MPGIDELFRIAVRRRRFLQGVAVASGALLAPRWARRAGATAPAPLAGFLSDEQYRAVEALTARLVSADDGQPGARECGVADYVQGLLSAFPGADANADGRVSAADLTAVGLATGGSDPNADANGDGVVDDGDRATTVASLFGGPVLAGPPAFAGRPIFAGGPFSDRNPYPDARTGTPSNDFPANAFASALPLSRLQRLAWTVRLLGADAVPEVRDNPLARTLADVDLRARYRDGLALVASISAADYGAPFAQLAPAQQDAVIAKLKRQLRPFYDLLVDHTIEGMLCAPEYGGNRDLAGWTLVGFDGDSQPLGYTIFDETIGDYRERPDKPNSRLDPDDPCSGFSPGMTQFLRVVLVQLAGATEFPTPFCFDE